MDETFNFTTVNYERAGGTLQYSPKDSTEVILYLICTFLAILLKMCFVKEIVRRRNRINAPNYKDVPAENSRINAPDYKEVPAENDRTNAPDYKDVPVENVKE